MARSRNIKPGFFINDELAEIDPLGRLLYIGLWTIADRSGRLEDRPLRIKAAVLPYDNCDIQQLLGALVQHKFIIRYQVAGQLLIAIPKWRKHQNPHKLEVESILPAPPDEEEADEESPEEAETADNGNSTVQAPYKTDASMVQNTNENETNPADSLNLIPDTGYLIVDSPKKTRHRKKGPAPEPKNEFSGNVFLTETEEMTLIGKYGQAATLAMIEKLSAHKLASGKSYKSDYGAINSWVVDWWKEKGQRIHATGTGPPFKSIADASLENYVRKREAQINEANRGNDTG